MEFVVYVIIVLVEINFVKRMEIVKMVVNWSIFLLLRVVISIVIFFIVFGVNFFMDMVKYVRVVMRGIFWRDMGVFYVVYFVKVVYWGVIRWWEFVLMVVRVEGMVRNVIFFVLINIVFILFVILRIVMFVKSLCFLL